MAKQIEARSAATLSDPRWGAVIARDPAADGHFVYSVRTTGVYCLPSCAARRARPENVQFHLTAADAERAGFRPCKRCRPDKPEFSNHRAAVVTKLCRYIDNTENVPSLNELARFASLSTCHVHRLFKAVTGVTPRAYAAAQRAARIRSGLARGTSVTEAIYGAGFSSDSRFYETSHRVLGMTPSKFRSGGADTTIHFAVSQCSLGAILVAASERGICAIALGDDPDELLRELQDRFSRARLIGGDADFERRIAAVVGFVEAPQLGLNLPLDVRGTVFQHRVWQALREVPPGQTASYADVARQIGEPKAARAVAAACAANTLAVAIPCHRVVRSDGGLSGYRWGIERKRALIERESKG